MKTRLQIALDDISMQEALDLLDQINEDLDIIEIGTPFMMEYGMDAIRRIKERCPAKELLCDAKIMDAGGYEAELAYRAGADYVTVLAVTDDRTIKDVVSAARRMDKKVMADMLCIPDLKTRIQELEDLGVDVLAVHTGVDQQAAGRTPLNDLAEMRMYAEHAQIAVAGRIDAENIDAYLAHRPEIIIVGSGIVHAADPRAAASALARSIRRADR